MDTTDNFSSAILRLDPVQEVDRISKNIKKILSKQLNRRGIVIGLSGGIDSSTTVALATKAIGKDRVLTLLMPEKHSADDTFDLSYQVADHFGVAKIHENISSTLESVGFYQKYDDAIRRVLPEYGVGWKSKIVIQNVLESTGFNHFSVVMQNPNGEMIKKRLPLKAYLEIVAATNFKQRIRKMLEYYHADRLNYAVAGTPNRLEYDQGFFVKLGDGAADFKPIAHLYKTQVYQLAKFLGVPEDVRKRPPTTDTYSLSQGQDEFYFSLPYDKMDLCLYAKNNNIPIEQVASVVGISKEQVKRVFDDIDTKRKTTRYLHLPPQLIEDIVEIK
jgi:NAD+ synthase